MSPNKRKTFEESVTNECNSHKHRRSSLRVNLSYTSNLTDSGHESYKKTEFDSEEAEADENLAIQASKELSVDTMTLYRDRFNLRDVSVRLMDVHNKEKMLEDNCKRLKDAILSKTEEIFDKQSELSIRTSKILLEEKKANETLQNVANTESKSNSPCTCNLHNDNTPTCKNVLKCKEKSRLSRRRLFRNAGCEGDDNLLKTNFSKLSLRHMDLTKSPVLSGSNKKLITSRTSQRSRQKVVGDENDKSPCLTNRGSQSTVSTIGSLADEAEFVDPPIFCSTFIERVEEPVQEEELAAADDLNTVEANNKKDTVEEINIVARVNRTINLSDSNVTEHCDTNNDNEKQESIKCITIHATMPMELTAIQAGGCPQSNSRISMKQILVHGEAQQLPSENSVKTVRTSLNVNTSIDVLSDHEDEAQIKLSQILECKERSINTVHSSLQVNTSLDSVRKTGPRIMGIEDVRVLARNSQKSKEKQSFRDEDRSSESHASSQDENHVSLEDMSLIERLRDISTRPQTSKSATKDKEGSSKSGDSPSYIEGTPYPTSRSVFLKSQLKYVTVLHNTRKDTASSKASSIPRVEESREGIQEAAKEQTAFNQKPQTSDSVQILHGTVILGDSPIETIMKQGDPVVIEESKDDIESSRKENDRCLPEVEKPVIQNRRMLLPLRDNSDLVSLTPKQDFVPTPEQPVRRKQRKKSRKKIVHAKRTNRENEKTPTRCIENESSVQKVAKEDDLGIFQLNDKKPKRPRRIVSKKIVIKRYAEEDMMRRLEKNADTMREEPHNSTCEGTSEGDFDTRKTKSIIWHRGSSHKIIIVTTGLSRGDKDLVRSVVKSLGSATIEARVTRKTTHVVSTGVRTINLLHGIIRGCWLVSLEWVLKSLEANKWLDPTDYEMTHFSKAVKENRKDRQLFGTSYVPELFTTCGFVYVENGTTPPCHVLKDLIKTAGGRITEDARCAKQIVGREGVKETWVLDSITTGELQPADQYRRA